MDEIVEEDLSFGDEQIYKAGPSEFLNLIANAEFVCTDSFHGTVCSIIHHKTFFTFSRHEDGKKASTNSRLSSLLGLLGIPERLYKSNVEIEKVMNDKIDYTIVDEKLNKMRNESINYLNNALEESLKK